MCNILGCAKHKETRDWCHYHYKQLISEGIISKLPVPTVEDRFWAKVVKDTHYPDYDDKYIRVSPADGACWQWVGATDKGGYGRFKFEGRRVMSHRIVFELLGKTPPSKNLVIDHLCRNPSCVNPDHLEPVTTRENTLRGALADTNTRLNIKKFCKYGHVRTRVGKQCLECRRKAYRERMRAHRGNYSGQ